MVGETLNSYGLTLDYLRRLVADVQDVDLAATGRRAQSPRLGHRPPDVRLDAGPTSHAATERTVDPFGQRHRARQLVSLAVFGS